MYRLPAAIILSSVAFSQAARQDEIAMAVRSPATLARYVESHRRVDWKAVRSVLGLKESEYWFAPCADISPANDVPCSVETTTVGSPNQAIVIIRGGDLSITVEYLRFLQGQNGGWQFAGENTAFAKDGPSHHEVTRVGGMPFLKISSNHSQFGAGITREDEDWFDLTQPDFEPVFSFTPSGGETRFDFGVGRTIHAQCSLSQTAGVERIDLILSVHFEGPGLDLEHMYLGLYERVANEKKFTLRSAYSGLDRRTTMPTEDFEGLANPGEPSNETLLVYALPGLQKIATGSDSDAKEWLRSILSNARFSATLRTLQKSARC